MDNPRKAREKERSRGAFLRGLKRTGHDGKGQYFGGNQGKSEPGEHERSGQLSY